jgi:hypothetical protein
MADDKTIPNRAANKSKAEGERWSSDANTVEQRDRDIGRSDAAEHDESGAGITNRPQAEEDENQASLPARGEAKDGANAGHGHLNRREQES